MHKICRSELLTTLGNSGPYVSSGTIITGRSHHTLTKVPTMSVQTRKLPSWVGKRYSQREESSALRQGGCHARCLPTIIARQGVLSLYPDAPIASDDISSTNSWSLYSRYSYDCLLHALGDCHGYLEGLIDFFMGHCSILEPPCTRPLYGQLFHRVG